MTMLYKFQSPERAFSQGREIPLLPFLFLFLFGFCLTVISALIFTSSTLANDRIPFPGHKSSFAILRQHYQFVVDGPRLIKKGYTRFKDGLFEIPRTFRFGQVVLCSTELIEELRNIRGNLVSPEPWIDQLLQISHVMPGYFPTEAGWPKVAKTTPGLIRGTVYKNLDRYIPSINETILSRLKLLEFKDGECSTGLFDLAYSIVACSGSHSLVGARLAQNQEYLNAVKEHILGMIVTARAQFLIPDYLKRYLGGFISHCVSLGTKWNMLASRKVLMKHFDARAAEYLAEINIGNEAISESGLDRSGNPIEIFRWLYESSVVKRRWMYSEVIGEMLLLQFAFIYTTSYGLYGALAELARRPEYIAPLRQEINDTILKLGPTLPACKAMDLMDSFLKECQRLHPPAALSAHRVCISDIKLSNGITLKKGSHVAVPSEVIQKSGAYYEDPETFDGFRFVKRAAAGDKNSRLVDLSPDYLVFGMGAHACPGRWMASALMKLALAHILTRYDILLPDSSSGPLAGSLSFEEFYVPNFGLKIAFRQRDLETMPETASQAPKARMDSSKRLILPPRSIHKHKVLKVLNPSAKPAETCMKSSHEEATRQKKLNNGNDQTSSPNDEYDDTPQSKRFEVAFSMTPQPFLDPPTWEAMLKISQQRHAAHSAQENTSESSVSQQVESAERLRQRVDHVTLVGFSSSDD
ncbi:Cytochrome P450 [Penicillium brevicompactum]|uniref:Cytochrome P450 n=1 Tax=Penicillium brevicompactum TaxID=5074 RepID=UPI00253F9914|nr:Cytochrome P450 [Penicillium brevicompactum]KAJ5327129.1 Cytochrome P450 [Penicillium brevicompactum]